MLNGRLQRALKWISHFGGRREAKGGSETTPKVAAIGILKREGGGIQGDDFYYQSEPLLPIIWGEIVLRNIIYRDCYRWSYASDEWECNYYRTTHRKHFEDRHTHFLRKLSQSSKRVFDKISGHPQSSFFLFLKNTKIYFSYHPPQTINTTIQILKKFNH